MNAWSLQSVLVLLAQILGPFGQTWVFYKFGWVFYKFTENGEFLNRWFLRIRGKNRDAWETVLNLPPQAHIKVLTRFLYNFKTLLDPWRLPWGLLLAMAEHRRGCASYELVGLWISGGGMPLIKIWSCLPMSLWFTQRAVSELNIADSWNGK